MKKESVECVFSLFCFQNCSMCLDVGGCFEMYFGVVGVFCTINCYFEYRIRIQCILLYRGT